MVIQSQLKIQYHADIVVLNSDDWDYSIKKNNELPEGMTETSNNDAALKEEIL